MLNSKLLNTINCLNLRNSTPNRNSLHSFLNDEKTILANIQMMWILTSQFNSFCAHFKC